MAEEQASTCSEVNGQKLKWRENWEIYQERPFFTLLGQAQMRKEKNRDSDEGKLDMKLLGQAQFKEEKDWDAFERSFVFQLVG